MRASRRARQKFCGTLTFIYFLLFEMTRPPFVLWLLAFVTLDVCGADADDRPSILVPLAAISTPEIAPRPISARAAAQLAAIAPKFERAAGPNSDATGDLTLSSDQPRNAIIRLPRYVVTEPKIRLPKEREVMTPKGQLEIALKRYPGLRFGNIWFLRNDSIALMMLEEDQRIERMREIAELLSILPASSLQDPHVKRSAQEIMMRPATHRTPRSRSMGR